MFSIPRNHPFAFGVGLATVKTGGVDFLVQKYIEKKNPIDWTRVQVFTAFGFAFTGVWQYALFVKLMPRVCPNVPNFINKPLGEKLRDVQGLKVIIPGLPRFI